MKINSSTLEELLNKFEVHKELFRHPDRLSNAHRDVTSKYAISMLKALGNPTEQDSLFKDFCHRFGAEESEMRDVVLQEHHRLDYLLYTAFAAFCQHRLQLSDEEFFHKLAEYTFLNEQDAQIKVLRLLPWKLFATAITKATRSATCVIEMDLLSGKPGEPDRIRRKTKPEYRERLSAVLGPALTPEVLARDCLQTRISFEVLFQQLYRQSDLEVITIQSESADPQNQESHSIYEICSTKPYRRTFFPVIDACSKAWRWIKPWIPFFSTYFLHQEQKRTAILLDEGIERDAVIQVMTGELTKKNVVLEDQRELLERRLDLILELVGVHSSSARHDLRNIIEPSHQVQKNITFQSILQQLSIMYAASSSDPVLRDYLTVLCKPVGLSVGDLTDHPKVFSQLELIQLGRSSTDADEIVPELQELRSLFGVEEIITLEQIKLQIEKTHQAFSSRYPEQFFPDPFLPLYGLNQAVTIRNALNDYLGTTRLDEFFEEAQLSSSVEKAVKELKEEESRTIALDLKLEYDPLFTSIEGMIVDLSRDLLRNASEHGNATYCTVYASLMTADEATALFGPLGTTFSGTTPVHIIYEDNGSGISPEKAAHLTAYLQLGTSIGSTLSTRMPRSEDEQQEEALGTKTLYRILQLYAGTARYEPRDVITEGTSGTRVHLYLQKLKL